MNERIEEFAKDCKILGEKEFAGKVVGFNYKKFAELIVKECIAQCWSVSELEHNGYVVSECSKRVRKHFGVEE